MGETTSSEVLYRCPVILNPKSMWQSRANVTMEIRREGIWFDAAPGLIPYNTVRSVTVRPFTDGVIEHDGARTVFQLTGLSAGAVGPLVKVLNDLRQHGFEGLTAQDIRKRLRGLQNYWALFLVTIALGSIGGALGGLSGGLAGWWVQQAINSKPAMGRVTKALLVILAIVGGFVVYAILVTIFFAIFPGLAPRK